MREGNTTAAVHASHRLPCTPVGLQTPLPNATAVERQCGWNELNTSPLTQRPEFGTLLAHKRTK